MEDFPTVFGYTFETFSKCVVHPFTFFFLFFTPQFKIIIPNHYQTGNFYNQLRRSVSFHSTSTRRLDNRPSQQFGENEKSC